jgi:hypothetical protein
MSEKYLTIIHKLLKSEMSVQSDYKTNTSYK